MDQGARFPRVAAKAGHYESFYIKACRPGGGQGLWIRHTVHKRPGAEPNASIWFVLFDREAEGPRATKVTVPAAELSAPSGSWIKVAGAEIGPGRARGAVDTDAVKASWDLTFSGDAEPCKYLPSDRLYETRLPKTKFVAPFPDARFDAARCGVAIYGLSPFGDAPGDDGLEPALRWSSLLAQVRQLRPGESTGYGRRFVAQRPTWIGIVPVGYADGFRRDLIGTEVRVEGEPRRVVGTISMDALAVELDRELPAGTPVTLLGDGVMAEDHARVAGTINYELVSRISSDPRRARRSVVDA